VLVLVAVPGLVVVLALVACAGIVRVLVVAPVFVVLVLAVVAVLALVAFVACCFVAVVVGTVVAVAVGTHRSRLALASRLAFVLSFPLWVILEALVLLSALAACLPSEPFASAVSVASEPLFCLVEVVGFVVVVGGMFVLCGETVVERAVRLRGPVGAAVAAVV
jgi:hypothetical protein